MLEQHDLGNVCANGVRPLTTYAWGTDFIADQETASQVWDFEADGDPIDPLEASDYIDAAGGVLRISSGDGFYSLVSAQSKKEFLLPATGKRYFFKARVRMSDPANCVLVLGLCKKATEPANVITDGIYFKKETGDSYLDLAIKSGNVNATTGATLTALHTLVADTWVDVAFEVLPTSDGTCQFWVLVDGRYVLENKTVTLNAPATEMGIVYAVQSSEASYKLLDLDYIAAGSDR